MGVNGYTLPSVKCIAHETIHKLSYYYVAAMPYLLAHKHALGSKNLHACINKYHHCPAMRQNI